MSGRGNNARRNVITAGICQSCQEAAERRAAAAARRDAQVQELIDALNAEPRSRKGIRIYDGERCGTRLRVSATVRRNRKTLTWYVEIDLEQYLDDGSVEPVFEQERWVGPINSHFGQFRPNEPGDDRIIAEIRGRIDSLTGTESGK